MDLQDSFSIALLAVGGVSALWLTVSIVGAIDKVPLVCSLVLALAKVESFFFFYNHDFRPFGTITCIVNFWLNLMLSVSQVDGSGWSWLLYLVQLTLLAL